MNYDFERRKLIALDMRNAPTARETVRELLRRLGQQAENENDGGWSLRRHHRYHHRARADRHCVGCFRRCAHPASLKEIGTAGPRDVTPYHGSKDGGSSPISPPNGPRAESMKPTPREASLFDRFAGRDGRPCSPTVTVEIWKVPMRRPMASRRAPRPPAARRGPADSRKGFLRGRQ